MNLNICNLGVIKEADIDLKSLTLFVGENGTGKTWVAYTLAGLLGPYGYNHYVKSYMKGRTKFQYEPIEQAIKRVIEKGNASIDLVEFANAYAETYINEIAKSVPDWINRFMATKRVNFDDLKYLAQLLIIDEPEMNLHPAAQAEITEFLCMLVNAGLYVLITTHSPYIVDHLSNLIHAKECGKGEDVKTHFYLERASAFVSKTDVSV